VRSSDVSTVDPDAKLAAGALGDPWCVGAHRDGGCCLCVCLVEEEGKEKRLEEWQWFHGTNACEEVKSGRVMDVRPGEDKTWNLEGRFCVLADC
jgi:hypothetical protein